MGLNLSGFLKFRICLPQIPLGRLFPRKFTCDGVDVNPEVRWNCPPCGTQSFAILMDDPDAVQAVGFVFVHWAVINLPTTLRRLQTNQNWSEIATAIQLRNSFNNIGWNGPCPPPGDPPHNYRFRLYALSLPSLPLTPADDPITITEFEKRFAPWILATGCWRALYEREQQE